MFFTVAPIVYKVFNAYSILLIIYIFMSWVPAAQESKFGEILARICEPYLGLFRKIIPPLGMIDFSPIIAIFALNLISTGVIKALSWIL